MGILEKYHLNYFFNLLNPYAVVAGVAGLAVFTTHGALFLHLKTDGVIRERALAVTRRVGPVATGLVLLFIVLTYGVTDAFAAFHRPPSSCFSRLNRS